MNSEHNNCTLKEGSPSVQAHLVILQRVIERMGSNSTSSKAWCITLVSAILVIVAEKGKFNLGLLALIPTVLFLALDTYYLSLEKGFRNSYNSFINKLHKGLLAPEDLYAVVPQGEKSERIIESLKSFSVWGFYGSISLLVLFTMWIVQD
jgi:hypothetical protein